MTFSFEHKLADMRAFLCATDMNIDLKHEISSFVLI